MAMAINVCYFRVNICWNTLIIIKFKKMTNNVNYLHNQSQVNSIKREKRKI